MKPIRVQLRRTKGWRMPENTVKVCRPSKWGNPFKVDKYHDADWCVENYRELLRHNLWSFPTKQDIQSALAGKNLACFCKLSEPCHADVLLEIANKRIGGTP